MCVLISSRKRLRGEVLNRVEIVNLTPHDVDIYTGREQITIPRSGMVARVGSSIETVGEINGIQVTRTRWGEVVGIPDKQDGVVYLVSSIVLMSSDRDDLVAPNTSQAFAVRDGNGNMIGCRALQVIGEIGWKE